MMDERGFERRCRACEQRLFRVCYAMLPEKADREDAIQEALIKAWRKRGTLRDEALFETWLVRIAINECKIALLAAAIIVLALAGTAVAAGFNVIEFFAGRDARLQSVTPEIVTQPEAALSAQSEALGESSIRFDSVYYDGESLIMGYVMQNARRVEPFTPTDEQLAAMRKLENVLPTFDDIDEEGMAVMTAFYEAIEAGKPFGVASCDLYPSDRVTTGDGVDVGPYYEDTFKADDGSVLVLREMESPLPKQARGRDSLDIKLAVWQQTSWYYFDGESLWTSFERSSAGEITAVAPRSESTGAEFAGEGAYNGAPLTLTASASPLYAKLTVAAKEAAFPTAGADKWIEVVMLDENGGEFACDALSQSENSLTALFRGMSRTPQRLSVYFIEVTEEEKGWDLAALTKGAEPIILEMKN